MTQKIDLRELLFELNDADKATREAAYRKLVSMGGRVVPALVRLFPEVAGSARLHVVRALGAIGHPDAAPLLATLVTSDDPQEYIYISSMAAHSLGEMKAVDTLLKLLQHERSGPRRMAATVLRNLCDVRTESGLIRALRKDEDETVRAACADALDCIGTPRAVAALDAYRQEEE